MPLLTLASSSICVHREVPIDPENLKLCSDVLMLFITIYTPQMEPWDHASYEKIQFYRIYQQENDSK